MRVEFPDSWMCCGMDLSREALFKNPDLYHMRSPGCPGPTTFVMLFEARKKKFPTYDLFLKLRVSAP